MREVNLTLKIKKEDFKKKLDIKDGKDAEQIALSTILEAVNEQLPKPEVLGAEEVVMKINELPTDDDNLKIDFKHIKNAPKQGGVTSRNLYQLGDVSLSAPTNGQVLVYNSTTQLWEAGTPSGGASWGSITGLLPDQVDLQTVLDTKAPKAYATAMAIALG